MNIILLGAPGAGKGTQADRVCSQFNVPHIATGDIIRNALKNGTEMGLKAKSYMDAGNLVPDQVVVGIVKERLSEDDCKNGFVFDGFPRTIPQAEALDNMEIKIDKVINIDVDDSSIINRMSGRRVCPLCGASFHLKWNSPREEGMCDKCKGALIQRDDDKPETVKKRLDVYHEQTEPLIGYYKNQGKLVTVDGNGGIDRTTEIILGELS